MTEENLHELNDFDLLNRHLEYITKWKVIKERIESLESDLSDLRDKDNIVTRELERRGYGETECIVQGTSCYWNKDGKLITRRLRKDRK